MRAALLNNLLSRLFTEQDGATPRAAPDRLYLAIKLTLSSTNEVCKDESSVEANDSVTV